MANSCIHTLLTKESAFYLQRNYSSTVENELSSLVPVETTIYTYNTQSNFVRHIKNLTAIVVFPILVQKAIQVIISNLCFYFVSLNSLLGFSPQALSSKRIKVLQKNNSWKYKRLTINMNGDKIDVVLMGKPETLHNKRWVIFSLGLGEFYETTMQYQDKTALLTQLNANGIFFNYPGFGANVSFCTKQACINTYDAILTLTEDEKKGIGAKEIIEYGFSIGGALQGMVWNTRSLKEGIKYLRIKDRTFSKFSTATSTLLSWHFGLLIKTIGWEIKNIPSTKAKGVPEIIVQRAKDSSISSIDDIESDGAITPEASYAYEVLQNQDYSSKVFLGIHEDHQEFLSKKTTDRLITKTATILEKTTAPSLFAH